MVAALEKPGAQPGRLMLTVAGRAPARIFRAMWRPLVANPTGCGRVRGRVARMFRALGRYGPSAVLAIAPLLTAQVSLLDLLPFAWGAGPDVNGNVQIAWLPDALGSGPKPEVEMKLRFLLTSAGVAWLMVFGYFDAYLPSRTLESFRHEYLSNVVSTQWRKGRLRSTLRVNVMYLRWRWFMPFGRSFSVVWKDKFHPSDKDGSLCLYRWQGACGRAARTKEAFFVDFRTESAEETSWLRAWLLQGRYHMAPWQTKKARHLKAILSVPMFDVRGRAGNEQQYCVGVINIDARTDEDGDYLSSRAKDLAIYLARHGQLITKMR